MIGAHRRANDCTSDTLKGGSSTQRTRQKPSEALRPGRVVQHHGREGVRTSDLSRVRKNENESYLKTPGPAVLPSASAPVAPVVATVRAPIVTVLYDSRRTDDRGGSRDGSAAEHSRPASASWA
jgi:hypothetical protein